VAQSVGASKHKLGLVDPPSIFAYPLARLIQSAICPATLRPFAFAIRFSRAASSGSSLTVTATRGASRGGLPAPLRLPPWLTCFLPTFLLRTIFRRSSFLLLTRPGIRSLYSDKMPIKYQRLPPQTPLRSTSRFRRSPKRGKGHCRHWPLCLLFSPKSCPLLSSILIPVNNYYPLGGSFIISILGGVTHPDREAWLHTLVFIPSVVSPFIVEEVPPSDVLITERITAVMVGGFLTHCAYGISLRCGKKGRALSSIICEPCSLQRSSSFSWCFPGTGVT